MKHAALAAFILLGACATAPAGGGGNARLGALAGSEWMMLNETRSSAPPTIAFTQDRASGYAGCNRWFASAGVTDQAIDFGDVGTTRMMCSPPSMAAERAFVTTLNDTRGYRIENGELVLYDIGGADLARFRRTN
ncbi:MAG: META domain-containing protein [Alphaproteobacteria bacterium]|nr:META domain-containing protein [Alphaproteobacteria bacterium]